MDDVEKRFYEKIARLDLAGVSVGEIASVVDNAESHVYAIMAKTEYAHIKASISSAEFEKQELLADAWQSIQAKALKIVHANLDWNEDPDFALKAAAIANKADMPGKRFGRQINAAEAVTATISLTVQFVDKLRSNEGKLLDITPETSESKINDVLSIGKTEALLKIGMKPEAADAIANDLGQLFHAAD